MAADDIRRHRHTGVDTFVNPVFNGALRDLHTAGDQPEEDRQQRRSGRCTAAAAGMKDDNCADVAHEIGFCPARGPPQAGP